MDLNQIDHLVITTPRLDKGIEWVLHRLGVSPQVGGKHPAMATHNVLLKLGEALYLEVIAPDPDAPKPDRPRWFALDTLSSFNQPKLAAWVVRTNDLESALNKSTEPLGRIEAFSRDQWKWLITVPADGSLPFQGMAPALIEWETEIHPASKLPESGCSFIQLEVYHPETARLSDLYKSIRVEGAVSVFSLMGDMLPHLKAYIQTPVGMRILANR